MVLSRCSECLGRFPMHLFVDHIASPICRMCEIRCDLQAKLTEVTKYAETLTIKVNALEEFASSNIGTEISSTGRRPEEQPVVVTSVPEVTSSNTNDMNVSAQQNNEFEMVRNGVRPTRTRHFIPINTYNHFQILQVDEEDECQETRLVGDSIVRGQLKEFCSRVPNKRKRYCMPGAGLDDVTAAVDEAADGINNNDLFIIHAGTNDVQRTRSEALLEKYRKMIQRYKTKTNNIIISGILPRIEAEKEFYNKAFSMNNRLESLCLQEGVEYINTWNNFYNKPLLFADDGLHLSPVGSARFGRLLNDTVRSFWSKNSERVRQASETT